MKSKNNDKEMSFLEHLEELRWHLVRSAIVILILMILAFTYITDIVRLVILAPLFADFPTNQLLCTINESYCTVKLNILLQATDPTEQFTKAILIAVVSSIIISFPYIVWEFWRFIKPGLFPKEIKSLKGVVFIISALFLTGVLFAYYVVCPFSLNFLATFQLAPEVQNNWRIGEVISLIVNISLAGGILFEMPVLSYVLSKIGILTPKFMRKYRRHAIVAVLLTAGVLTPSPDILSQVLLALPMMLLYEISIIISARIEKKRLADDLKEQQ